MGYLGKQPALQASEYREEFNITSTTTNIITSGFVRTGSSNYLEVYRNGVLLGKADYTLQSDYKTIVLTNAAVAGDIVVVLGRRNLTQGLKVAERRHEHVIQNGETTVTFPFPLTADITDVYINGVKLWYGDGSGDGSNSDYAINPVTRVISFGLNPSVGDTVSIVSREPTSVSSTPLPLIDSNGASVISENGGVISLSADTAVIEGLSSGDLVRITQTGTGNALVVEDSANPDSTPFVVDASGNVGIGTSSPSEELEIRKDNATIYINGGASAYELTSTLKFTRAKIETAIQSGTANGDTRMEFHTRTSGIEAERMRIDSSGNILFGNNGNIGFIGASGGDVLRLYQNRTATTPWFYFNTSGGYGVYSDARLKENITSLSKEDATNLIKNINPIEFNWKSDSGDNTKRISGVLAQDVLAYATTEGQKNILTHWETFDESDPDCPHMGLSDHRLIPSIIGTIQHLLDELDEKTSQIEALTTRIETLESNTTT